MKPKQRVFAIGGVGAATSVRPRTPRRKASRVTSTLPMFLPSYRSAVLKILVRVKHGDGQSTGGTITPIAHDTYGPIPRKWDIVVAV